MSLVEVSWSRWSNPEEEWEELGEWVLEDQRESHCGLQVISSWLLEASDPKERPSGLGAREPDPGKGPSRLIEKSSILPLEMPSSSPAEEPPLVPPITPESTTSREVASSKSDAELTMSPSPSSQTQRCQCQPEHGS